ncbi:MAG: DUF3090 domain-containing protein [Anaerolineae bacterium]
MPEFVYDLDPASFITIGALGPPGQRTFYLQATQGSIVVSLIIEKEQAQALSSSLDQLLEALEKRYPQGEGAVQDVNYDMALLQPVNGLWRVGQMGLGYDEAADLIILVAQELIFEEDDELEEPEVVRLTGTRRQMEALSRHATSIVGQGRPLCPLCHNPKDPQGHFCPPSNGHRDPVEL